MRLHDAFMQNFIEALIGIAISSEINRCVVVVLFSWHEEMPTALKVHQCNDKKSFLSLTCNVFYFKYVYNICHLIECFHMILLALRLIGFCIVLRKDQIKKINLIFHHG